MHLLGLFVAMFSFFGNTFYETAFGLCVGNAIIIMCIREFLFYIAVLPGNVWMLNEVVSEKESVPMLELSFNHVDVMRSVPVPIPLYEPSIEWRRVISK